MIPAGTTHFSNCYDIILFWKKVFDFRGIESGENFYTWTYWENEKWIKDRTASSRKFLSIKQFFTMAEE